MPESLEQAKEWYAQDIEKRGLEICGDIEAHWQGVMFSDRLDAHVIASVRRKKNAS